MTTAEIVYLIAGYIAKMVIFAGATFVVISELRK